VSDHDTMQPSAQRLSELPVYVLLCFTWRKLHSVYKLSAVTKQTFSTSKPDEKTLTRYCYTKANNLQNKCKCRRQSVLSKERRVSLVNQMHYAKKQNDPVGQHAIQSRRHGIKILLLICYHLLERKIHKK